MSDRTDRPQQIHVHRQPGPGAGVYSQIHRGIVGGEGPSASKVLAVITLVPIGGSLLGLAGLTLVGTLIGLAVATPLFLICSPVLVPAALGVGLSVFSLLTAGAIGLSGISSLSWVLQSIKQATETIPSVQDMAVQMGQRTKEVGQTIESKARESKESVGK